MRRLIIGDIHAHYDMLRRVLDKAAFDPDEDVLYSVGDLLDRGDKPVETLRFLMSLPHFRPVLGNHDAWFEGFLSGRADDVWLLYNGGSYTAGGVRELGNEEMDAVRSWFSTFPLIRAEDDILIIHGGIPAGYDEEGIFRVAAERRPVPVDIWRYPMLYRFLWDRDYLYSAMSYEGWTGKDRVPGHFMEPLRTDRTIFIGHTQLRPECVPFVSERYHLIAIDTGTGSGKGPLTVMDMDTREYWQAEADGIRIL